MGRMRVLLGLVLLADIAVLGLLQRFVVPMGKVLAYGVWGIDFVGFVFAVGVLLMFWVTFLRATPEDLWETSYFRYMRSIWGSRWGGLGEAYGRLLIISVCRATWLSSVTALLWASFMVCTFFVLATMLLVSFKEPTLFFGWEWLGITKIQGDDVAGLGFMVLAASAAAFFLYAWMGPEQIVERVGVRRFMGGCVALGAFDLLIVWPLRFFSFEDILYVLLVGGAVLAGIVVAVVLIIELVLLSKKGLATLSEQTVPGILIVQLRRGWREHLCFLIIQGRDTVSEHH